jgi:hypothetical protein
MPMDSPVCTHAFEKIKKIKNGREPWERCTQYLGHSLFHNSSAGSKDDHVTKTHCPTDDACICSSHHFYPFFRLGSL